MKTDKLLGAYEESLSSMSQVYTSVMLWDIYIWLPPPHGSTFLGVYPRFQNHFRCMHVCACIYPSVFHVSRFLYSEQKGIP